MTRDRGLPLLLLCFFLSGLAALVYETAWTREFAFVFGTSNLAVATVLAAYMGGLALGAAVAGRLAPRIERPVLAYGLLELGIALAALGVPFGIAASRSLYVAIFGGLAALPEAGGTTTALFYLVCSFVILLVPTAMMGATLPLLARHAVTSTEQIGRRVGLLYATNTAGAVAGVLLAAFVLLPALGLRATIFSAAGINALVFLAAWALARRAPAREPDAPVREAAPSPGRARWILPLVAVSGFASFSYEVFWVRLLGHLVGASVNAFATMLASFLLGIALGSAVAARWASSPARAATGFAIAQLGIAALSAAAFALVGELPDLSDELQWGGASKLWADVVACMATLFPAALCIGATFPCAVRVLARRREDAGPMSARVYAWNTVGAIAGSIAAGFALVPMLGFEKTLLFCLALNLALAAAAAGLLDPRRPSLLAAAAVGAIALAVWPPQAPWKILRATSMIGGGRAWGPVAYLGVGRSSTVLVTAHPFYYALRTNGLPEAGMTRAGYWHNYAPATRWLTALPVLARPEARRMLVVGFGGGMLLEVVPESVEHIDVVELEPEVIAGNRAIAAERWRDPLTDPRVDLHLNDARNALLLADARYDAIVSQPSHPWAGGAAHLYTREFAELVERRLSDDGVFVQWIGSSFVDEELFASLLAGLDAVFEHVEVYHPPPQGSLLLVASNAPLAIAANAARAIAESPADFSLLGIDVPEDVLAGLALDERSVREIAHDAVPNRDRHNRLQARSARLGERSLAQRFDELIAPVDPLEARLPEAIDRFYLLERLYPPERMARVAGGFADPVDRRVGEALAEMAEGKRVGPKRRLERVLEERPRHEAARAALLRLSTTRIAQGLEAEAIVAPPLSEPERILARAWRIRAEDASGEALLAMDDALATVPMPHPLGPDAARLRTLARIDRGDPERLREALAIVEASLGNRPDPRSLLLRAEAYAAVGEPAVALEALGSFARELAARPLGPGGRPLVRRAREIALATSEDDPEIRQPRRRVLRLLGLDRGRG